MGRLALLLVVAAFVSGGHVLAGPGFAQKSERFHKVQADGGRSLLLDVDGQNDTIWDSLEAVLPLDGGALVVAFESPSQYSLLRVNPGEECGVKLTMVYRRWGYDRVWFETVSGQQPEGNRIAVRVERSPLVDREDWRPWKIVLSDPVTGKELLRQGMDNTYPVFGMGRTGLLLSQEDDVSGWDFSVRAVERTNRKGALCLAPLFSDGMVLQRDRVNRIWGKYLPGGIVAVTIDDRQYSTVALSDGSWSVDVAPMAAGEDYRLEVKTVTDTLVVSDVAAGEVWLAAGQSNMEMRTWQTDVAPLSGDGEGIRFFLQPKWHSDAAVFDTGGRWMEADINVAPGLSAVGFAFAVALRDSLQVPVGIISSVWGGTAIESWMPREILSGDPLCMPVLERYNNSLGLLKQGLPTETVFPWCWDVAWQANAPGNIFNSMVRPHIPYGIRGVLWYQGESNASKVRQYGRLFPMMIETWRRLWEMPQMPFHFVQVAGYDGGESGAEIVDAWPYLRDEQRRVAERMKGVCMTVAFHLGDRLDIHPYTKLTLGTRLAGSVLNKVYGYGHVPASGPLPVSVQGRGDSLIITFAETGAGLTTTDGMAPAGFVVAAADGSFAMASARLGDDGRTVILRANGIREPVHARYGWENYPSRANLCNAEGLPASPFRTDSLRLVTHDNL